MINIVTKVGNNDRVISDPNSYFDIKVKPDIRNFGELDLYAMDKIDNAKLLDSNTGSMVTNYGVTDVFRLSSGCKTVLSYLYMMRHRDTQGNKVLDITYCGANAIEVLFQCADKLNDSKTIFLLNHTNNLRSVEDRDYSVNGIYADSLVKGVRLYG